VHAVKDRDSFRESIDWYVYDPLAWIEYKY